MSNVAHPKDQVSRRIWSDPLFFVILGAIGGTYVLLIVVMLLADAAFIFTSDMSKEVVLDFSTDGEGKSFSVGDFVADRFAHYGLTVKTDDEDFPARILDSDKPSAANSPLGTPHQDFGGAGTGVGGAKGRTGQNVMPLGKVVIIADNGAPLQETQSEREFVFTWVKPVRVESLRVEGGAKTEGELVTYSPDGAVIGRRSVQLDDEGRMPVGDEGVVRMDVTLPASVAAADVAYRLHDEITVRPTDGRRKSLKLGSLRIVPGEARQLAPSRETGTVTFQWRDPVRLDEVSLLNVDGMAARVAAYDLNGERVAEYEAADLGSNSVQRIQLTRREDDRMEVGLPDVARLDVRLPPGAAIAEITFAWQGRVRSAWERDRPLLARLAYNPISAALAKSEIRYSIKLSLISCTMTTLLSLWVAVPIGYLLSRHEFFGRHLIDAILDIPIVLPPLVVGLSLLILFQFAPASIREAVVYQIPAVILAQFAVACAFAVRTMRATFDHIDPRREQVALTLGCSRAQAFGTVVLPEARRGMLTAGTLAWARSLGEFGPLLIFAGATRNKTEVLSTTVFLELSIGDLGAAVAVSLIMVVAAVLVLVLARLWGTRSLAI